MLIPMVTWRVSIFHIPDKVSNILAIWLELSWLGWQMSVLVGALAIQFRVSEDKVSLKFIHLRKTVALISFLSKLWYFQYKSKQKWTDFSKVEFVCWFIGRNLSLKKSYQICLNFNRATTQHRNCISLITWRTRQALKPRKLIRWEENTSFSSVANDLG